MVKDTSMDAAIVIEKAKGKKMVATSKHMAFKKEQEVVSLIHYFPVVMLTWSYCNNCWANNNPRSCWCPTSTQSCYKYNKGCFYSKKTLCSQLRAHVIKVAQKAILVQ